MSGMSTAHTFDCTTNGLLLPPPKGGSEQRRLSSTIKTVGFQTAVPVNPDGKAGVDSPAFCRLLLNPTEKAG